MLLESGEFGNAGRGEKSGLSYLTDQYGKKEDTALAKIWLQKAVDLFLGVDVHGSCHGSFY